MEQEFSFTGSIKALSVAGQSGRSGFDELERAGLCE